MESSRLELENFLPYRLNRLADAVSREFSAIYRKRHGLTRPEWRLVATLGQFGTMTATEIGHHSAMHKTKVSRAVASLETRRWVTREQSADDRRVEHLTLTHSGRAVYLDMVPIAREFEQRLWQDIDPARRAEFESGLERLEQAVIGADP